MSKKPDLESEKRKSPSARSSKAERHLGATEDKVGDRTGSGAGYDLRDRSKKPRKGGVKSS